jgi:glycosyltransferase involved in cell wall biosynthesis
VLLALHEIWPEAPLFTSVYNPNTAPWAKIFKVESSFLQKFPLAKTTHELYPWLTPLAFESFNFDEFDVVISVTSADAKGIITKPKITHICYCLTPTRYLWSGYNEYFCSKALRVFSSPLVSYLRLWDKVAATRPDFFIAISKNVQRRIKKYYGRESTVIYPPVDIKKFKIENLNLKIQDEIYFLVVSRLVPYKRIDIAIEAFNKLGLPLKVIGTGLEEGRLRKMAQGNIEFLGNLTDRQLVRYYQNCQALIFPTEEDFGLAPLEVQACGRPVIAFAGGGALESVVVGKTGDFFCPQNKEALLKKVLKYKNTRVLREKFKSEECRQNAERFSKEIFKRKIKQFVEEKWQRGS